MRWTTRSKGRRSGKCCAEALAERVDLEKFFCLVSVEAGNSVVREVTSLQWKEWPNYLLGNRGGQLIPQGQFQFVGTRTYGMISKGETG